MLVTGSRDDSFRLAHAVTPLEADGRPHVVLITGLGRQLIDWDPALVWRIQGAGYRVITVDNRDAGKSPHLTEIGKVPLGEIRRAVERGEPVDVPYLLADMAQDVARTLDELEIDAAHIVGVSMGGYIAQELALIAPERVLTLTSIMSSTGDRTVGQASEVGMRSLFRAPSPEPEDAIEDMLDARRILATPDEFDEALERARVEEAVRRSFHPEATGRQLAAIWASPDRTERLGSLTTPTLVIHGEADELVGVSGGHATAAAIPGAELLVVEGMGHDLPPSRWPVMLPAMVHHFNKITPPTVDPRIEPVDPGNADTLAAIATRAFDPDRKRYGSGPPGLDDPAVHRRIAATAHAHQLWTGDRLAGAVYVFDRPDPGAWELGTIFIDPDLQGEGLGSRLMEFVERATPAARTITLETPYRNTHLHRFYEGFGYRRIGKTTPGDHPEATDPDFHLFVYRKEL